MAKKKSIQQAANLFEKIIKASVKDKPKPQAKKKKVQNNVKKE